jgi:hypothetical protein
VGQSEHSKSRGLQFFNAEKLSNGNRIFVHHRIVSAAKLFVRDRMLYVVLRGWWINIIVLNVRVSRGEN